MGTWESTYIPLYEYALNVVMGQNIKMARSHILLIALGKQEQEPQIRKMNMLIDSWKKKKDAYSTMKD